MVFTSSWGGSGPIGPPLVTTCSGGGRRVAIEGGFGPERVQAQLIGLHPGRRYRFVAYQSRVSAVIKITESGPVPRVRPDTLGPLGQLESKGGGTLSVAKRGRSGALDVTLPGGDALSGRWTCGTAAKTRAGQSNRPTLAPASVPPVVDECWAGTPGSNPPAQCPDGDLNVAAWVGVPPVLGLGRRPSLNQVASALCQGETEYSLDVATLAAEYAVAAVYYGWSFHTSAASIVASHPC